MVAGASSTSCLSEDELLRIAQGALADEPRAEAHLASCPTCSALLASIVRGNPTRAWNELAGTTLGPYRIDAQIGAGGMGAVYRAWDPRLGRAIAVKVLHSGGDRLAAEARAAAAIDHRAIVGIHDVGVADGVPYVAMELVDGESLRTVLSRGPLGMARGRELTLELVDALAAAHACGVIHRDLKPENLVLAKTGLRVLDFGLAKLDGATALDVTEPGTIQGTAGYMAPEQARGERADARTDLFAVGAIAYEMVTGQRAFPGATTADRLSATLRDTPDTTGLGELAPIVARCLAKEPRERFQSAADLAWAIRSVQPSSPPAKSALSRRAVLAAGAGAIATTALGVLIGRWWRRTRPDAMALSQLTHRNGRVYTARFTPGGDRVIYGAAWDGGPIQLFEVALGSAQTNPIDLPDGDLLSVSKRSELAVSFEHRFVDHQSQRGHLAIVPIGGGEPRLLVDDVEAADFAPDVKYLTRASESERRSPAGALAVLRVVGGRYRVELPLGTTLVDEPTWCTHLRVSPNGQRVAYVVHPHSNHDGGQLVVVEVATAKKTVVSENWTSLAGLAWDPDGESIWFTGSVNALANSLHRITLAGDTTDIPGPTADRLRLHDIADDRRLLVTMDAWRLRAMTGDHAQSLSEVSAVTDMSADGAHVLIGELGELESGAGAYLVPYATGRRLRLGPGYPVAISPSGQRVAANVEETDHLVVYSIRSSDTPVMTAPGWVTYGRWLDEDQLIAQCDGKLWRLAVGKAPVQIVAAAKGPFVLDPARKRIAYVGPDSALTILDVGSGKSTMVPATIERAELCGWLAASDAICVRSTTTPIVVDAIDVSTGTRTHLREIQPPRLGLKAVDSFVLHADGERFAYSYGEELSTLLVLTPR